jgi:hypothetical protein
MKTFKNKNFTDINPDCTNVIFCQADTAPSDNWIECEADELRKCHCARLLYIQDGIRYFGVL